MVKCEKCGSKIFYVDETATHLEINGEIGKQLASGDLHNRNCVKCTFPEQYEELRHLES